MALEQGNLTELVGTSVEDTTGLNLSDIFLGLVKTVGEKKIEQRFGEATPPINRNAARTDTAEQELEQNRREAFNGFFNSPKNTLIVSAAILGVVILSIAAFNSFGKR